MIDTLMYVKKLEAIGISREQAELQVQVMADIVDQNYATKQDFTDLRRDMKEEFQEVRHEMKELRAELSQEIKQLRTEFKHDAQMLESRLTIKLGSMMVIGIGAIATLIKFF